MQIKNRLLRLLNWILLFIYIAFSGDLYAQELKDQLLLLSEKITITEELAPSFYKEKYVLSILQSLDYSSPETGTFNQRIIICHVGADRPTVLVTEGYGGAYALHENYQDELSRLFNTNIIFVEHRYFQESTPEIINWDYLTAENAANDLHTIRNLFADIYPNKWISTGISKGGENTIIYRTFFPGDVDISVPYVAPLNRALEDIRHEEFLQKIGTNKERKQIEKFQKEILKRKQYLVPLLEEHCKEQKLDFRIPMEEVLDFCVLEYPFAFWQWGTPVTSIPNLSEEDRILFDHLMAISSPDYFSNQQPYASFFVQAAKELGYYGYDTEPFKKYLTLSTAKGYIEKIMLPESAGNMVFSDQLYQKVYSYLKENDPKMICIYGENDPWTATRVPDFEGKKNLQIYIQPNGSHRARIMSMPKETREQIIAQIEEWLE